MYSIVHATVLTSMCDCTCLVCVTVPVLARVRLLRACDCTFLVCAIVHVLVRVRDCTHMVDVYVLEYYS
jgi:hypothetical protein